MLSWPSSPQPPGAAATCRPPAPLRLISFPSPLPAATFIFQNPAIFEASSELGDITGLYMNDDEGAITVRHGPSLLGGRTRSCLLRLPNLRLTPAEPPG